ncbi:MAG: class B sortase [Clostridia bacterium]|nr:class B sortase [Clostridia bacterium]
MSKKAAVGIPIGSSDAGEFKKSLSGSDEDIKLSPEASRKNKKRRIVNIAMTSFIVVCAAVLVVCIVMIVNNLLDKKRGEEIYDDLADMFAPVTVDAGEDRTSGDDAPNKIEDNINGQLDDEGGKEEQSGSAYDMTNIRASISKLKEINSDVVGWISVENTKINYPLLRSSSGNDEYYLDHAANGEYLAVGSIFMVSNCDVKLDNNYNTLIYGHNVVNGAMFHDVMKFLDPEFFKTKIYIYTLDGIYVYQPFSIYQTRSDYNYIQTVFSSVGEFLSFAAEMKSNSQIWSDISIGYGDTMITLSTCTGTGVVSKDRYSLHAKLVEFIGG